MGIPRWAILVGISMVACGQTSSEPAPSAGSAAPSATSKKAAISAPERPTLAGSSDTPVPVLPAAIPPEEVIQIEEPPPGTPPSKPAAPADKTVNPGAEFQRQTRDPSWAGPTETEIQKRVTKLGVRLDQAECRQDRCLIAVRGTEEQLGDAVAKLESRDGLQGFAQSIYLSAPVDEGGKLVVRAYATFDR
jgi:hypothetical protein